MTHQQSADDADAQRPAQLGVSFYKDQGRKTEQATCARCGGAFASAMMVRDLAVVERQLGFRYELDRPEADHYQWVCPKCRRALFGLAQGAMWARHLSSRNGGAPTGGGTT